MKRILLVTALVLLHTSVGWTASLTDPGVPHTINLQSIVYDASGNVTKSDKVDVSIRILDADHNVVFSEDHADIQVIEGAINLEIGSESGGVPLEALDPSTGTKLIDVLIDGANPFDLMPLGAVPYAMWAERAVTVSDDAIESRHIKNGTIKAEDIDPLAFSDIQGQAEEGQLPSSVATDAELNAHISSGTAHPASAIVVSGSFITFVATNVQEGLQKLDQKLADEIVNRQNAVLTLTTNLNNEILARGDGDTALQGQIDTVNTNLTNHVNATTVHGSDGAVVGVNTLNTGLGTKVSKSGDTMSGNLDMGGHDITNVGNMNGTDVSNLGAILANKKTITGSQDITSKNSADVWVYQERAGAQVRMFLIGGFFNQSHYTELAKHNHGGLSHTHRIAFAGTPDNSPGSFDSNQGIDLTSGDWGSLQGTNDGEYITSSATNFYEGIDQDGIGATDDLSSIRKAYLHNLEVFVDGTDVTSTILSLAAANNAGETWSALGDNTEGHPLNDQSPANPGTGMMDLTSLFSATGFHRIEFREPLTNRGGRLTWTILVD